MADFQLLLFIKDMVNLVQIFMALAKRNVLSCHQNVLPFFNCIYCNFGNICDYTLISFMLFYRVSQKEVYTFNEP